VFDIAIIGAGINGSALAYFLSKKGKKVAIFDGGGIASGGSGAAGAFISAKIAKGGDLKAISDEAFDFSMRFYSENFPNFITDSALLHLSKHKDENDKVKHFKEHTHLHVSTPDDALLDILEPTCKGFEALYLKKSGVVNAKGICEALIGKNEFINEDVHTLTCKDNYWELNSYKALHVILATGAYTKLLELPYIKHRGVWGHRIDIKTDTKIPLNIHQFVSISASKNGYAAIGATHNVHYHPQTATEPYDIQSGRRELLEKASQTIELKNVQVLKDYTGLRSGSNDYIPIIGSLVDAKATIKKLPNIIKGKKYLRNELIYYPNISMINGTGGYGFVLAPYLASMLCDEIADGVKIDKRLEPVRFFERFVKRGAINL
jgi:tRNA 5-methylaminomethyl-2-thiouridine biosynthesis bifunctional protein